MILKYQSDTPTALEWSEGALVAGQTAIASMRERLNRGVGEDGQQMPAYARLTRELRAEAGRQIKVRDLQFTGGMVRAIAVVRTKADENGFELVIGLVTARARELALKNQLRSRWFGWSPSDTARVDASLADWLKE